MNFALRSIFLHTSKGSLTCRKILQHGVDGFYLPPKEDVLWIFIFVKNPPPSAGVEPSNLGSRDKHANHFTPEDDSMEW
jgi:hypothetical protein